LKGWRCCDANDIMKNETEEPKTFSHNGFQECSYHLYSRWQKFIGTQAGWATLKAMHIK